MIYSRITSRKARMKDNTLTNDDVDAFLAGALGYSEGDIPTYDTTLLQSLEAATEAILASVNTEPTSTPQVKDLSELAARYLTTDALKQTGKRTLSQIVEEGGTLYRCVYFACQVAEDNLETGVKEIAASVNELAAKGLIHSALAPLFSITLVKNPLEKPTCAVFCFVLVPASEVDEINASMKHVVQEGGLGELIGSNRIEIPDGEVRAVVRIACGFTMILKHPGKETMLQEEIGRHLAVLPKGTKFEGYEACAISDLSFPYELKFSNPLFREIKTFDMEYVRICTGVDEVLHQGNLLLGVRYFDADGKQLYV